MFRKLNIALIGVISIFSLMLILEIFGSANDNSSEAEPENIVKFSISPVTLRMYPGGSMQLVATAYDSRGNKIVVTPVWVIKSDISSLGEFDKSEGEKVIFSALNSGSGSIIAFYNDLEAEVRVEIYHKKK